LNVASNTVIPNFNVKVEPNGFRLIVPAGAAPEVSGAVKIWTGVIELKTSKTKTAVGGSLMSPSILSAIRVRVDASNKIVGCEGPDSYVCPDGKIQMGPYSSQCMTPEEIFAGMCAAGQYPVSNGATIDCKSAADLIGGLCPAGKVAVSNGTGVDCKVLSAGCFGSCSPNGSSIYDATVDRILDCTDGCWNVTPNTLKCLPPSKVKKGDDEWMTFKQDNSARRSKGSPCKIDQKLNSSHADLNTPGSVHFDDTSKSCTNDQNCAVESAE
jgi:hypothetical protein